MSLIDSRPTTILQRLTAARAAFLDAPTSSRAPASSALNTTQWTNSRATKLDNLDALVSAAGAKPPTTNGLKGVMTALLGNLSISWNGVIVNQTTSTHNIWIEILGEASASGVISVLGITQNANANSLDWGARLSIDGLIVWTSANNLFSASGDNLNGIFIIGSSEKDSAPEHVLFKTSFSLEIRKNEDVAGTIDGDALYKYYLTG